MATYYDILRIDQNASQSDIKKAYRIMAKKYHPDLNPDEDAHEQFIEIEVAYSCLSNSDSKLAYDRLLKFGNSHMAQNNVLRKYKNDVERRTSRGRTRANVRTRMSYKQYQRDELLKTSAAAAVIQVLITIIMAILLAILFYNAAVIIYGSKVKDWGDYRSVYLLGGVYTLSLIGLSYIYEPLVNKLIIGKPKK